MADLAQLLQMGGDAGGFLLVWVFWQQHKRLEKLENKVFPAQ